MDSLGPATISFYKSNINLMDNETIRQAIFIHNGKSENEKFLFENEDKNHIDLFFAKRRVRTGFIVNNDQLVEKEQIYFSRYYIGVIGSFLFVNADKSLSYSIIQKISRSIPEIEIQQLKVDLIRFYTFLTNQCVSVHPLKLELADISLSKFMNGHFIGDISNKQAFFETLTTYRGKIQSYTVDVIDKGGKEYRLKISSNSSIFIQRRTKDFIHLFDIIIDFFKEDI